MIHAHMYAGDSGTMPFYAEQDTLLQITAPSGSGEVRLRTGKWQVQWTARDGGMLVAGERVETRLRRLLRRIGF